MFTKEEITYIQKEIQKNIKMVEQTYSYEYLDYEQNPEHEDFPGYTKVWLERRIREIYNLISVYLEGRGLIQYLAAFQKKYNNIIEHSNNLIENQQYNPEEPPRIKIIQGFTEILDPFAEFGYLDVQEDKIQHLSNILQNTDYIVENTEAEIKNEADIYNQVKWVLHLYYPSSKKPPTAYFSQWFKTYKPDLLIPELNTVIEYKFIKDTTKTVDDYIDEVRTDANNYDGDSNYNNFIAVICMAKALIATRTSIEACWNQKNFPKNWRLIIVIGFNVNPIKLTLI